MFFCKALEVFDVTAMGGLDVVFHSWADGFSLRPFERKHFFGEEFRAGAREAEKCSSHFYIDISRLKVQSELIRQVSFNHRRNKYHVSFFRHEAIGGAGHALLTTQWLIPCNVVHPFWIIARIHVQLGSLFLRPVDFYFNNTFHIDLYL
jgi:hypothetical protein